MDRIKGAFFSLFLGDALGAPHEFASGKALKYNGLLDKETSLNFRFHKYVLPVGSVTDDSEMSLALLSSIKKGGYDPDRAALAYMSWANSGGRMMGRNTRALFRGVKTLRGYKGRAKKVFAEEVSQSNGCLMRCLPLALIADEKERKEAVRLDVNLSNPDALCREVVSLQVELLHSALQGTEQKDLISSLSKMEMSKPVKEVYEQAVGKKVRDVSGKSKGWILHAFYCSMYALHHFSSFKEAMKFIILLGGDTDTNAAIAGPLIGALLGYVALEKEEKDNLAVLLSCKHERPKEYTPAFFDLYFKDSK